MIHGLFEQASILHGHKCPGLAIGVRAGFEALRLLAVTQRGGHLCCIAESRACYIDGLQMVFGTTMSTGNIEIRDRGKAAFNFYDRSTGKTIRLYTRDLPDDADLDREEMIEYILTAPMDRIFSVTEVHFPLPEKAAAGRRKAVCSKCGETCTDPYFRERNGQVICMDCDTKA